CASAKGTHDLLVPVESGKDHHPCPGELPPDPDDRLHPIKAGHLQIHEEDIGAQARRRGHSLRTAPRLADHLEIGLRAEHRDQPLAHVRMVVGSHDPDRVAHAGDSSSGTAAVKRVPSPRVLCTLSVPPSSRIRSHIPTMPKPFSSSEWVGRPQLFRARPIPSSSTSSLTCRTLNSRRTATVLAWAWRSALASASCATR